MALEDMNQWMSGKIGTLLDHNGRKGQSWLGWGPCFCCRVLQWPRCHAQTCDRTFICIKLTCVSHNWEGVTCTANGCNTWYISYLIELKKDSGKVIRELFFCIHHWELAYDSSLQCWKMRQYMNQGCTNNEFGGRYHMVQTQKLAIILDVRIRWSVRVEVWRLWQRKWQM